MMNQRNNSWGNISRDSGYGHKAGHSRNVSDASQATTATNCDEETRFFRPSSRYSQGYGSQKSSCSGWRYRLAFFFVGLFVMTAGFLVGGLYFPMIRGMIQNVIKIQEGGEFYNFWIKSSAPTEVGLYFFHVENPWAVENGLEKLHVREVGKYYFKQIFERDIHNYADSNRIVNFTEHRYFIYDEEKTQLSLDDNITVVNVPYAALGSIIPRFLENDIPLFGGLMNHIGYRGINSFLEKHEQQLFINTTVRELIYGYKLDFLDTAMSYSQLLSRFGITMKPSKFLPNNSFGILNGRNGTPDGPYEMYTGQSGTQDLFGVFKTWNGLEKLDMWQKDSTCNMINGTDGTIWPAGVKKTDRLYFYIPDVCRSLYLTYFKDSSYKGIPTQIFSIPDEVLAGSRTNPDNACFCMERDAELIENRCTLDGVFDASICQDNVPIIVSLPHFMNADKRITDRIVGLKPDEELHRPELHVEPLMGALIYGDSRLQMSIRIPKNEDLRGFDKLAHDLYVPIFWGYKKLGMSDDMAVELQWRLFLPYRLLSQGWKVVAFSGFAVLMSTVLYCLITFQQDKKNSYKCSHFPASAAAGGVVLLDSQTGKNMLQNGTEYSVKNHNNNGENRALLAAGNKLINADEFDSDLPVMIIVGETRQGVDDKGESETSDLEEETEESPGGSSICIPDRIEDYLHVETHI